MSQKIFKSLSQEHSIQIKSLEQLKNGYNLILVALKLLYSGQNQFLQSKLSQSNPSYKSVQRNLSPLNSSSKAGNNVITINALLKHIKTDRSLPQQTWVRELTFFNILEDEEILCKFITWMLQTSRKITKITIPKEQHTSSMNDKNAPKFDQQEALESVSSNRFRNIEIQNPRYKTQQNSREQSGLQNLFFASNIKNKALESQIIISPEKSDKIMRKGSFKLLKPKVNFNDQSNNIQPMELKQKINGNQQGYLPRIQNEEPKTSINYQKPHIGTQATIIEPDQLKQISMIEASSNLMNQNVNSSHLSHIYADKNPPIFEEPDQLQNKKGLSSTPVPNNLYTDTQNRKTIPKNISKPPLYRSSCIKNKENILHGSGDKNATVQQSQKKKQFFNFSQTQQQDISTFNFQSNYAESHSLSQNHTRENFKNKMQSIPSRKLISKTKGLKHQQKSQVRQFLAKQQQEAGRMISQPIEYQGDINQKMGQQKNVKISFKVQSSDGKKQQKQNKSQKIIELKNHFLKKQLYNLDKEILKQETQLSNIYPASCQTLTSEQPLLAHKRSMTLTNNRQILQKSHTHQPQNLNNRNNSNSSLKKSNRKISKIALNELTFQQKNIVLNWLNGLHFISSTAVDEAQIMQKFKDGVKFVELCNYHVGRGRHLPVFNSPKRNAQVHSNFSKVFQYLKNLATFQQNLLIFAYELFVPYPQQNSIWNLLFTMYKSFQKKGRNLLNRSANKSQQLIVRKQNASSLKQQTLRQFQSQSVYKNLPDRTSQSTVINKQPNLSSSKKISSSKKTTNFNTQIEFVRQVPEELKHQDLVQNQQPECYDASSQSKVNQINQNVNSQGYKERYLRKTIHSSNSKEKNGMFSLETPKKYYLSQNQDSFIVHNNKSISKNSARNSNSKKSLEKHLRKMEDSSHKNLSGRKLSNQYKIQKNIPKTTLNMEIKTRRVLKLFNLEGLIDSNSLQSVQLFNDPIRNGTIINMIYSRINQSSDLTELKYLSAPKSIQNCRQNYVTVLSCVKNKYGQQGAQLYAKYFPFVENILKGEINIFYALAYNLIQILESRSFKIQHKSNKQNLNFLNNNTSRLQNEKINRMAQNFITDHVEWIRFLQRMNHKISELKIRDSQGLRESISSGIFLFSFSQSNIVKPVYVKPANLLQKQANLRKIIGFFIQNNMIFQKDQHLNIKFIAQKNVNEIDQIIQKLIFFTVRKAKHILETYSFPEKNIDKKQMKSVFFSGDMRQSIPLGKYLLANENNPKARLQTTTAQYQNEQPSALNFMTRKEEEPQLEIPWLRKLGFVNCPLLINNGILLCRLMSKLSRSNITFNENLAIEAKLSKPESLGNIRKAIKLIPGFKFDEIDVYEANAIKSWQILDSIKQKFRNTYEMTKILSSK